MPTALFGMYHRGLREKAILEDITGGLTLPKSWERAAIAEKDISSFAPFLSRKVVA